MNQPIYSPTSYNSYLAPRNNGITWVQGIEGAKAWQLPPNSNVMLLDSETEGRFYIKTSDNIGMCNLRIFEYKEVTEHTTTTQPIDMSKYITRAEVEEMLKGVVIKDEQPIQPVKRKLIGE